MLKVYYLPGIPEVFQRSFQIQIAHLDPENITLYGEGIFPQISLDLHRNLRGIVTHCSNVPQRTKATSVFFGFVCIFEGSWLLTLFGHFYLLAKPSLVLFCVVPQLPGVGTRS